MAVAFSFDNGLFRSFAFYATICILKMMVMSIWTSVNRMRNKAFENPEDCKGMKKDGKYVAPTKNERVERARRNHLNDIENIIPFVLLGFLYVLINPAYTTAVIHFRVFTAARLIHTICYQVPFPQPSRALSFTASIFVNVSMAVQVFLYAM